MLISKRCVKNECVTSPICVDASFILRTLIYGPNSDQAINQLEVWQQSRRMLIAPTLISYEVTSTIRRYVYFKQITPEQGDMIFTHFLRLHLHLNSNQKLLALSLKLAQEFNRPTSYDTTYLALAQLRECEFWTADKRLFNAVKDKLVWVKYLE